MTDLHRVYFVVNTGPTVPAGGCHGFYDRATNALFLYNDNLSLVTGPLTPGAAGVLQNSQCRVNGSSSQRIRVRDRLGFGRESHSDRKLCNGHSFPLYLDHRYSTKRHRVVASQ